jgi:hypothetical protein
VGTVVTTYGVCMLTPLITHEFVSLLYITLLTTFGLASSFRSLRSFLLWTFLHWGMMSMQRPVLCFILYPVTIPLTLSDVSSLVVSVMPSVYLVQSSELWHWTASKTLCSLSLSLSPGKPQETNSYKSNSNSNKYHRDESGVGTRRFILLLYFFPRWTMPVCSLLEHCLSRKRWLMAELVQFDGWQ